jgi:GYF domain 2
VISSRQSSIQTPLSRDGQWFVFKNDQTYGPVQFGDLARLAKQGLLLEDDWVWRGGLDQWIAAKDISELFTTTTQLTTESPYAGPIFAEERGGGNKRTLKERILDSIKSFMQMFLYLWLVFGLLAIHQSIILSQYKIDYQSHGLAVVNALVFAKVMLIAEDLRLGDRFNEKPLIYPILFKSLLFAIALMCFHIAEHVLVGMWHGQKIGESVSEIGADKLRGIVSASVIATVALIPFFALREISRVFGRGQVWSVFFHRRGA